MEGLEGQYVAIFANSREAGYCSNLKADLMNVPEGQIYDTEYDCCEGEFLGEAYCLSHINPDDTTFVQPSGAPSLEGGGLPDQFVAVFADGYEEGYCSNLKADVIGTPELQIYASEFDCCEKNFADQTTKTCISKLPAELQPSGAPSFYNDGRGGLDVYVPFWPASNSYEGGYCSNLKEHVNRNYVAYPMDSQFECCQFWFGYQTSGVCLSKLPGELQPSSAPSFDNNGNGCYPNAKFFPRWEGVGTPPATDNYCDDDLKALPSWQTNSPDIYGYGFDTLQECCDLWFPHLGESCSRRQPTCSTLPAAPIDCGFYPKHAVEWAFGTCVNDCKNRPEFDGPPMLFTPDKAGGVECCNVWFENNGLTTKQIGSGRLSYCLEELEAANPSFDITAPPTYAPPP